MSNVAICGEVETSFNHQVVFRLIGSHCEWAILENVREYTAISHTWGAGENLVDFTVAGRPVRGSLWKRDHLENWLRKTLPEHWIWLDLVSIPQTLNAVAACLRSIPLVYSRAQSVCVILEDVGALASLPSRETLLQAGGSNHMDALLRFLDQQGCEVPNPSWIYRLWTRQEAQYARQISFHAVGVTTSRKEPDNIRIRPFGPIGQLASSLVPFNQNQMGDIFVALIRGTGEVIRDLAGLDRQRDGGLFMTMDELRASLRWTTKHTDFITAVFPAFEWFDLPQFDRRNQEIVPALLEDAFRQHCLSGRGHVLSSIVASTAAYTCHPDPSPLNTFDVYCGFVDLTPCEHDQLSGQHTLSMQRGTALELVDWSIEEPFWSASLREIASSVRRGCQPFGSIQRYSAKEALEVELGGNSLSFLLWFCIGNNDMPDDIPRDWKTIHHITACFLVINLHRLEAAFSSNQSCVLVRTADGLLYPGIVDSKATYAKGSLRAYHASGANKQNAGICWIGYEESDLLDNEKPKAHLVGSFGGRFRDDFEGLGVSIEV